MKIEFSNLTQEECDESALSSLADFTGVELGLHPECELSISLVDEMEMGSLHQRWMDEPGPTDVLSFPMDEMRPDSQSQGPGILGDIVLCPAFAARQADSAGHSLARELELLTTHGILHLLGFDHREEEEKNLMFTLQDELLAKWRKHR